MEKTKCKRCGHEWIKRQDVPIVCPKCKSPYWNKEKIYESKKKNKSIKK